MRGLWRALVVLLVCTRYRLDLLLPRRGLLLLWPFWLVPAGRRSHAERLALALERLGPVFVKLGQLLANRADLLPAQYIAQLSRMRDGVNPLPARRIRHLVQAQLGQPLEQAFAEFEDAPLASASIAQVHRARLPGGDEVAVKVVRPGLARRIRRDIRMMRVLARVTQWCFAQTRRLQLLQVLGDFEQVVLEETDLRREAAYAQIMQRNARSHRLYRIPRIYEEYTRPGLMVSELISGIALDDIEALDGAGVDRPLLARRGVRIFFTQLLQDNFFHADMHPGNHFVDAAQPDDPRYISLDCAIVGSLDDAGLTSLASIALHLIDRNYSGVAAEMRRADWVPPETALALLARDLQVACEPVLDRPIAEVSMAAVLMQLFETGRKYHLQLPASLALLNKTLFQIEGLGRQLDPGLDLWAIAGPMLREWRRQRYRPDRVLARVGSSLEAWGRLPEAVLQNLEHPPQPPARAHNLLHLLAGAALAVAGWGLYSQVYPLGAAALGLALLCWWGARRDES